jgi:hypothetical protein
MTNKDKDKIKLQNLSDNCYYNFNWAEEGGSEVERIGDKLHLYEIPQYGGEGRLAGVFELNEVDKLLDLAYSWT